jgi:hypothetical protein
MFKMLTLKGAPLLLLRALPFQFNRIEFDRKHKALVLSWIAETEAINIVAVKMMTIRPAWPPINSGSFFYNIDSVED